MPDQTTYKIRGGYLRNNFAMKAWLKITAPSLSQLHERILPKTVHVHMEGTAEVVRYAVSCGYWVTQTSTDNSMK